MDNAGCLIITIYWAVRNLFLSDNLQIFDMKKTLLFLFCYTAIGFGYSQVAPNKEQSWGGKFEQIDNLLPTPNVYRAGDGAPGPSYWQQKADYKIKVVLDDALQRVTGEEDVTYYNQSPQSLSYIWLQLDQNIREKGSDKYLTKSLMFGDSVSTFGVVYNTQLTSTEGGIHITSAKDGKGKDLDCKIVKTMMRIDLEKPLKPGEKLKFHVEWWYNLNDRMEEHGRSGYEYFPEDQNFLYSIAQFYPRLAVYDDFNGWQHKQFLGSGEFALTFGDFEVEITVPSDHVVTATGTLKNAKKVLTTDQYNRLQKAKSSYDKPVIIIKQEEAIANEQSRSKTTKTWLYEAENVRDFAFASSRKFIWDAQAVKLKNKDVLAMSFYPKEGNPLWELESTKAVVHTLKTYSKYSIDYPYPVANSVHAASIGMEYPMICFNLGRPDEDGTYSDGTKYAMIGVVIHEVGHNFFPMIVNSDERQWAWMDEGINSFLEYLTKEENYENFPHDRGPAHLVVKYMKGDKKYIRPMMTNPEQVVQLGYNAYSKPATSLNILRNVVLGPELFDKAFKTYSERWAFKHPKPADFFRTMEDASGIDLDWFWRGWYYSVDYVDISIDTIVHYDILPNNLDADYYVSTKDSTLAIQTKKVKLMDSPDYYYGEFKERIPYNEVYDKMKTLHYYQMDFSNLGGLVMPIVMKLTFEDGATRSLTIPAEVWRYNEYQVKKVFSFEQHLMKVEIDPHLETADADTFNNVYPRQEEESEFDKIKTGDHD